MGRTGVYIGSLNLQGKSRRARCRSEKDREKELENHRYLKAAKHVAAMRCSEPDGLRFSPFTIAGNGRRRTSRGASQLLRAVSPRRPLAAERRTGER